MNHIELMAPAGSPESLTAALKAGAASIYFGVDQLNMRALSKSNFMITDLPEIAEKCRRFKASSYLALNTILFDDDLKTMRKMIDKAVEAGLSGVIVSDPSVMKYACESGIPVHMSTQCNITNIEAVEFYSQWADVMILARELTLEQVKSITKAIEKRNITGPSGKRIRIEIFIHGALCMAVSGKCCLSLYSHNLSANRGSCVQNCRRPYEVEDGYSGEKLVIDNPYIMSAKDLCTLRILDKVVDSGVSLLKIEGRARSADYVHTVVSCYREALEAIQKGTFTSEKIDQWEKQVATVYNRGFWEGYYLGHKTGEWSDVYGSKATKKKIFVGQCENYYQQAKVAAFRLETGSVAEGEELLVIGPTTGVVNLSAQSLRVDDHKVKKATKGELLTIHIPEKIRRADKLYKLVAVSR